MKAHVHPITAYFVEVRNFDGNGASGFHERGYLDTTGEFYVPPGPGPNCHKRFRATDLPDDVVVLVGCNQVGKARSAADRKTITKVAEAHGFRVKRGAKL